MKYALIAYCLYFAFYDHWSGDEMYWDILYFAGVYAFPMAVSCIELVRTRQKVYLVLGIIFAVLVSIELSYLLRPLEYSNHWEDSPAYLFTGIIIAIFLIYEIILKWKKRALA